MLYLAFIYHMHQPYYKNLLTQETGLPWVRLHGTKDYLDMVQILEKYPAIHQTFNFVPSLLEQVEDYGEGRVKDKFLELSYKPAADLSEGEKHFIREKFFMINRERVISTHPRYYELYFKKEAHKEYTLQDYLDLQVWFNLAWIDPSFRQDMPELRDIVRKARHYSEEDKQTVLNKQLEILKGIIPAYKQFMESGQIEVTVTPYYHPILPLLYNTRTAREAELHTILPHTQFAHPEDARAQVELAVDFFKERFGVAPDGMWPSEESVSCHIAPFIAGSGIKWIVADEAVLFKSLKKKRSAGLLYQPHLLKTEEGDLNIVFRDRNLSDLIGFVYYNQKAHEASKDFIGHLENIHKLSKNEDILVTIAMDGENAWEYYRNDGHDFLNALYQGLSEAKFIKTTTVKEYLATHKPKSQIKRLAAGSWIYGNFLKWIGNHHKNLAWEYLAAARDEFKKIKKSLKPQALKLAEKQMYIAEGSDWFWWYGENHEDFDRLFRMHLSNFYKIIGKDAPDYLNRPLA